MRLRTASTCVCIDDTVCSESESSPIESVMFIIHGLQAASASFDDPPSFSTSTSISSAAIYRCRVERYEAISSRSPLAASSGSTSMAVLLRSSQNARRRPPRSRADSALQPRSGSSLKTLTSRCLSISISMFSSSIPVSML